MVGSAKCRIEPWYIAPWMTGSQASQRRDSNKAMYLRHFELTLLATCRLPPAWPVNRFTPPAGRDAADILVYKTGSVACQSQDILAKLWANVYRRWPRVLPTYPALCTVSGSSPWGGSSAELIRVLTESRSAGVVTRVTACLWYWRRQLATAWSVSHTSQ